MDAKIVRRGDDFAVELVAEEAAQAGISEGQALPVVLKPGAAGPGGRPRRTLNGEPIPTLADMIAEMDRLGPENRPAVIDWGPDVGAEIIRDD
ncbi:AbrB/MazE/SpoVT family DNA-binding domain-containing protein [Methylobacterium sp. A54F]